MSAGGSEGSEKCGDYGGVRNNGQPCGRTAGWGTDKDTGPCKDHTDEKREKEKAILKKIIDMLEEELVSMSEACRRAGSSVPTVHRYRKKYPDLAERIEDAVETQEEARIQAMEDALFKDALKGEATGAERIFWLKNRAPDRWKDRKYVDADVTTEERDPIETLRSIYEEETGLKVEEKDG